MQIPDVSDPLWFLVVTGLAFMVVIGRYFFIAGLFYAVFYLWFPRRWKQRKINDRDYSTGQFRKEVKWSTITALIFALSAAFTVLLWQKGFTKVYTDISAMPVWWLPVSLVVAMVLHETYYYWVHRWMHHPKIFRVVHKVHHDSNITSPFTAFSFHPIEGLLQAIVT